MLVNCGKSTTPVHCGNVTWYSCGKLGAVPQNTSTELPFDPEVPLRGISSKELKASTGTSIWAPVFLEALFTVAEM